VLFIERMASALFFVPFALVLGLILLRLSRWQKARWARVLEAVCFVGAASILVLTLSSLKLVNAKLWSELLERKTAPVLVFQNGRRTVTVTEQREIERFFASLQESRKVSAHHSHPMTGIRLTIGEDKYRYSIAADSDRENEFWIQDLSCDNCDERRPIAQVASKGLSEYLRSLQMIEPLPAS